MKKILLLLLATTCGTALADKDSKQLAGLQVKDICPIGAFIYNTPERISSEESKVKDLFSRQDKLFNTGFMDPSNYLSCTQGAFLTFEYNKSSNGEFYFYTWNFKVYSKEGQIKTISGNKYMKDLTIYDMGGYGISTSYSYLQNRISEVAESAFQDFVLDCRKSH